MNDIIITKGNLFSDRGAKLNRMALEDMTRTLMGTTDENIVEATLTQLWQQKENRFSHEYTYEAKQEGNTLGLVTCYPVKLLNRLAWPTVKQLLQIRKWPLVLYAASHLQEIWNLLNLREGREDEFHIGTIATAPESRGMGVGTKLLLHAEDVARQDGFSKMSLTVKQKNVLAHKLYQRMGYETVGKIDKNPFFLYRMVKHLS